MVVVLMVKREMKALQECEDSHHVSISTSCITQPSGLFCHCQVVRLRDVFPHGQGFVLVFDYMLSDLAAVMRNSERPLTEVSPCFILLFIPSSSQRLLPGPDQELHDPVTKGSSISTQPLYHAQGKQCYLYIMIERNHTFLAACEVYTCRCVTLAHYSCTDTNI